MREQGEGDHLKILVVFTGGTIGSSVREGYISPEKEGKYTLLEKYEEEYGKIHEFITLQPYTILSENLTGESLQKLKDTLVFAIDKEYDGIIVTHGTDTLQYSAAMAGYALGNASKPVIFVSSNYVLEDERANGYDNFVYAIEELSKGDKHGVYVSYRNQDGRCYLHRGTRVLPHLPCNDEVFSLMQRGLNKGRPAGRTQEEAWERINGLDIEYEDEIDSFREWKASNSSGIVRVYSYPGMTYPILGKDVRAVMLDAYHSGTICMETGNRKQFFEQAKQEGIPVFLAGANYDMDYESVKDLEQYNILVLPMASPIALYMKLWMAMDMGLEAEKVVYKSLAGDLIPKY